jgi:TIR domain
MNDETLRLLQTNPNDPYVRTRYLNLVREQGTLEQKQEVILDMSIWLQQHFSSCDSYVLTAYLSLLEDYGTSEQSQAAISQAFDWLQVNLNDSYVRRRYLKLVRKWGTLEQKQTALTHDDWLQKHSETCDSYALREYLLLVEEQGTLEQQQIAIKQASIWLQTNPDDSYIRQQYLKLIQVQGTAEQQQTAIEQTDHWLKDYPNSYIQNQLQSIKTRKVIKIPEKRSEPKIERNQIFISYSHQNKEWLIQLQKHLKPMVRSQDMRTWDDTKIQPGAEWRKEIEAALAAAKVAVLMVSPEFLESEFIHQNELPSLLNAAQAKGLTIIWIPLSYSLYDETEIEKYQAAHSPNQPLDILTPAEQNRAWVNICKQIKAAMSLQ